MAVRQLSRLQHHYLTLATPTLTTLNHHLYIPSPHHHLALGRVGLTWEDIHWSMVVGVQEEGHSQRTGAMYRRYVCDVDLLLRSVMID